MSGVDSQEMDETTDPATRWIGLSTVVGFLIAIHYPALIVAATVTGHVNIEAVAQPWFAADTVGWLGVMTYIFGEDIIKSGRQALGKD